jgi:hypothetical protein
MMYTPWFLPRRHTPSIVYCAPSAVAVLLYYSAESFIVKWLTFAAQPTTFEVLDCTLRSTSMSIICVVIYQPPSQGVNELFYKELICLLETVATYRCQIVVCGDFNIHINNPNDKQAQRLAAIIESLDLVQSVVGPTHRAGNTLDLVLTRRDCCPSSCDVLPPCMLSDHSLIVSKFPAAPFAVPRSYKSMRPWKKLDMASFITSLRSSALCADVAD